MEKGKSGCKESHEPGSEIVAKKKKKEKEVSQRSKQQRQVQRKTKFDKN